MIFVRRMVLTVPPPFPPPTHQVSPHPLLQAVDTNAVDLDRMVELARASMSRTAHAHGVSSALRDSKDYSQLENTIDEGSHGKILDLENSIDEEAHGKTLDLETCDRSTIPDVK